MAPYLHAYMCQCTKVYPTYAYMDSFLFNSVSYIIANITLVNFYFSVCKSDTKSKMSLTQNKHPIESWMNTEQIYLEQIWNQTPNKNEGTLDRWQENLNDQ